ncbi:kin of IRRE 2 [Brachionus plicatilis]|uniref:Kin of IRRE 2 n=1 Tax=Brachionus plicatilis TaxID=10195 RepID=A0A3M7SXU7_BRAPC|nr:kin of IRRE 2 [Brachionus plicatilis]
MHRLCALVLCFSGLFTVLKAQDFRIELSDTAIKTGPSSYIVKVGDTVTIPCHIENLKKANVIWQYSKSRIPETLTVGIFNYRKDLRIRVIVNSSEEKEQSWDLEIRRVRLDDEGYYLCKVMAEPESLKRAVYLRVEADLDLSMANRVVNSNDNVILTCNSSLVVDESSPLPHRSVPFLKWFKDNDRLIDGMAKINLSMSNFKIEHYHRPFIASRLIINKFSEQNVGEYKCMFRNQTVSKHVDIKNAVSRRIFEFGNGANVQSLSKLGFCSIIAGILLLILQD